VLRIVTHQATGAEDETPVRVKTHKVCTFKNWFGHKNEIGVRLGDAIFNHQRKGYVWDACPGVGTKDSTMARDPTGMEVLH
jgi:hypothetical protein